ncbi:protein MICRORCHIDIA 6-like isoform X2 [Prunus avium]|uniref:Protein MICRORCHIDIA 6-like isoform X2 n=1 Tax=Prunus avium TaxID=42229 RepID=A0A6P5TCZ8_PRUAV|nr:protein MICRORCHIDIA 6-like isoform X2 [Prunus avium]
MYSLFSDQPSFRIVYSLTNIHISPPSIACSITLALAFSWLLSSSALTAVLLLCTICLCPFGLTMTMSNSNIIDLCSDDEMGRSNIKKCRMEIEPGFDSASAPSVCPTPISRQFWKAGYYEIEQGQRCKAANQYGKNHMRIHPMFLHSNATSHKWAFGAMAELLDNAVDEVQNGATFVSIDKISTPRYGTPALLIRDDGGGMDPDAIRRCMSFGFSDKKSKFTIGQYGNGFKTSSMRLGADVIVFSRHLKSRSLTQSVGLLSYTFLRWMGYNNVVVPMVDYEFNSSARTFGPLIRHDEDHFSSNLTMLLQWSPYSTEDELLKQFDDIGDHGTKVVIYNLWLNDDGEMELDFDSDPEDICINGDKTGRMKPIQYVANLYQHSLRAYASILYRQLPHYFRIILRGQDIEYHNIAEDLKYVQFIKYMPQVDENLEVGIITAIGFLKEAPHANTHGFNIYHRNRLILPFWRAVRCTNSTGRGVVGVLEPDFIQPTHNKQDFEKTSLFQKLEDRLKQMTVEYWNKHCKLIGYQQVKITPSTTTTVPSSATQNCVDQDQPLLLNHGSQYESSNSRAGLIKKRKDLLDPPLKLQHAKRHMGSSCGTDVQCISEQPENSVEGMMQVSQKMLLMQENKRLRSQLLTLEKMVQELDLKVQQLMDEQENLT